MFAVGFATEEQISYLKARGYEVEDATKFGRVVGPEVGTLTIPPEPGPDATKVIAIFLDADVCALINEVGDSDTAPDPSRFKEQHGVNTQCWPELPFDEEFLRIVLLQSRLLGKDTTVEPFTSYRDELEWRRIDKQQDIAGKKLSVEHIVERRRTMTRLQTTFTNQQHLFTYQQGKLCSHMYADGKDASSGVPVSDERWCQACGSQYD